MLNDQLVISDINAIEDVEWMLNEKEDARAQDFLRRDGENE